MKLIGYILIGMLALTACGKSGSPGGGSGETPPAIGCGNGLAATDLSGKCRAKPQATMGALEAVDS